MNERPSTSKETSSNVGSPSPRKKRTNSTPINRKNPSEKKMILQQLISPNTNAKVSKLFDGKFQKLSIFIFR